MRRGKIFIIGMGLLFTLAIAGTSYAQEYTNFAGVFHIQSTISDGRYPIEEIMARAEDNGIQIVVLTDCLLRRWEYGLRPFRNLTKRRMEERSVLSFGVKNYLRKVDEVQRNLSNLVILPAVEVTPFYYWEGSPLSKNPALYNCHEQMLVIGLDSSGYKKLPVVSNYSMFPNRWGDLLRLWPITTIFFGIWLARKRIVRRFSYIIVGASIMSLVNNLFFPVSDYDQYHGYQGIGPYQALIDYVNERGGLTFWAHPETDYSQRVSGINIYTYAYPDDLVAAQNYTGFASLYPDNITFTKPADKWDQILIEYCEGKRERPVWGVGDIDYHGGSGQIGALQTIFLLPRLNREEAFEALKRGRIYAKSNSRKNDFSLDRFVIKDSMSEELGYMGDEVICRNRPKLYISGTCSTHPEEVINIQLIRYGEVIKTLEVDGADFDIEFEDDYFRPEEKIYYRLKITSPHSVIISNPIFVQFLLNTDSH